jgi:GR25 family glycosyltransferase involved in LPS biosynthesis
MPVKKRALAGGHHLVSHLTRTTSSAAYVVNRRAAETLLKSMRPITEQVDHALDSPWETGLRTRGIRPMPVVLAPVAGTSCTIGYQDKAKAPVRSARTCGSSFRARRKKSAGSGMGWWRR